MMKVAAGLILLICVVITVALIAKRLLPVTSDTRPPAPVAKKVPAPSKPPSVTRRPPEKTTPPPVTPEPGPTEKSVPEEKEPPGTKTVPPPLPPALPETSKPETSKPDTSKPEEPGGDRPDYEAFHHEIVPPPPPITRVRPVAEGALVAIIIDDIGYDRKMVDGFLALNIPITLSVLPYGPFNSSIIAKAKAKGVELMLHLPMEPVNYPKVNPGPGALLAAMTPDQLISQLNADLGKVSGIKGVNNHMGSKLTTSAHQMRQIFTILKKHDLFFVDSRTSSQSRCRASAQLLQLPFAERDVFLDHEQTPQFVRQQIGLLIRRAKKQGYAIAIGHPHKVTLTVLREMLPELQKNVSLSYVSQVVALQGG